MYNAFASVFSINTILNWPLLLICLHCMFKQNRANAALLFIIYKPSQFLLNYLRCKQLVLQHSFSHPGKPNVFHFFPDCGLTFPCPLISVYSLLDVSQGNITKNCAAIFTSKIRRNYTKCVEIYTHRIVEYQYQLKSYIKEGKIYEWKFLYQVLIQL